MKFLPKIWLRGGCAHSGPIRHSYRAITPHLQQANPGEDSDLSAQITYVSPFARPLLNIPGRDYDPYRSQFGVVKRTERCFNPVGSLPTEHIAGWDVQQPPEFD